LVDAIVILIVQIWWCVDKYWLKDFDDDKDVEENAWRYWRQYSLCLKIVIVIDLNFYYLGAKLLEH